MKLSLFGRWSMALFASLVLGLGMTACGGGTIGYMWVLGQQYNNIAGFKIDDYTGNLTQIIDSPFNANGAIPVSLVVKPGGRFVYVVNQGTCPTTGCGTTHNVGAGISVYSVGGDGTLVFQEAYQTQGYNSMWAQMDATGSYLYVLDKYAPGYIAPNTPGYTNSGFVGPNTTGTGSITVFSIDPSTGRLFLQENSQTLFNNVDLPFWYVGPSPFMMRQAGGCLFSLNNNNTVSAYAIAANQLSFPANGATQSTYTVNATSISGGGSYVVFTDNAVPNGGPNSVGTTSGAIQVKSVGSGCTLTTANNQGDYALPAGTFNPVWAYVDTTGKYLYVLNNATTNTQPSNAFSTISAFTINSTNQQLAPISGSPYPVGSGPVCMVEDPTNQYFYISDYYDGTVTGKVLDPTTGILSVLARGSTFAAVGHAGCLAISGSVS